MVFFSQFAAMTDENTNKPVRFYSTSTQELDEKRRIQVPTKWRKIGEVPNIVMRKGQPVAEGTKEGVVQMEMVLTLIRASKDNSACITAIPLSVFERYTQKIDTFDLLDPVAEKLRRFIGTRSEQVTMDTQGRITIPSWMLERVGIEAKSGAGTVSNKVVLVGEVDRFSIWSKEAYDADEFTNEQQDLTDIVGRI
jgi:division/cell wall cluster transcriptional repressor MraZ